MAKNNSALEQLKIFLNELFQFDSQDLDFGVYKILHYKRKEIKDFIDKLLVDKVKEQLQTLTSEENKKAAEQLKELEQDEFIQGWINANEEERKIAEKLGKQKITEYKRIKTQVTEAKVSGDTENHIYNHLTLFFSRYYDKGDFISKRRFGKNEKYMVPYNGEETHFYWANHDQYYIKSSETFQQYAFKITTQQDNMVVNFKLTSAQLEQGNVKADEPNFFILSEKEAEIGEKETNFFFEYRPLTSDEKKTFKGNNKQDVLDERAFEALKNKYGQEVNLVKLWETDKNDKALLLKKINHYTRKNKYDFFIHKNLKGFLQRELDYYIKSELINVDDLYVTEVDSYFDRLKHNVKTIKVFKTIADTIIEFVSQIEDFQKKLWEKKKFVLSTEWVITIDRLVEYIGEEAAKPILEEVIKNEKQVAEWKELFGEENVPNQLSIGSLKADLHSWRKFTIDTKHFERHFTIDLLNRLSEKINLEEKSNGLVMHSDNYHGIINLKEKFYQKIDYTYIDPPYNTKSTPIIYKNEYKSSSWASLMENRLSSAKDLQISDGILTIAIDDAEGVNLSKIIQRLYSPLEYRHSKITVVHNPKGSITKDFNRVHEYAFFVTREDKKNCIARGLEENETPRKMRRWGENSLRTERRLSFYPIYIKDENIVRVGEIPEDDFHPEGRNVTKKNGEIEIWPIDQNGIERRWNFGLDSIHENLERVTIQEVDDTYDLFVTHEKTVPKTVWRGGEYDAGKYGNTVLIDLLGDKKFDFPKSINLVKKCIQISTANNSKAYVLDYFPGSGTTFHSTMILNSEDKSERKCILIEQGDYINTIIIPRIKKIAYTFDWSQAKPKDNSMNGLGVFFKYQRLEQYEEALENIAFTANKDAQQQALEFDQYIPKYMLEFETKNSQTLVNTEAMQNPWEYKLKVWDGFTYDTEQAVDLVETFNYLIGLHMQKCITKEINGNKYQFVYGHNNANKNILAVWRSVKDWKIEDYKADSEALKAELKNYTYDLLYINEQAHIEGYQPIEEVFKNKMLP
jgi:adenine-specific DNA-methyltransferase